MESTLTVKHCKRCDQDRPLDQFYRDPTRPDGRSFYCSPCRKRSDSLGPAGERRRERQREAYLEARAILQDLKNKPCEDCGQRFPWYVMEFDHPDPTKKKFNISYWVTRRRIPELLEEISKCDLLCCTCHRIRTYAQRKAGLIKTGRPRKYFEPDDIAGSEAVAHE